MKRRSIISGTALMVVHTIKLNGFWTPDDPAKPTRFTRRFGMPRMIVAGESAWLVVTGQPLGITINDESVAFTIIGDSVEIPLGSLPARNTLTVAANTEPVAVIEIRSGV